MKDERYWPVLGAWLKDTVQTPPDPRQTARQVAERLPRTKQVGRHWWLPSPRRAPSPPTRTETIAYEPDPIPAISGHTPTVIGRTQTMFSPSKAFIAGALVFGIGGVLLIAQPFEQRGSVPGAETEAVAPTWVTGSMQHVEDSCSGGASKFDPGVTRSSYECTFAWTSSDPRLTGDVSKSWNEDAYQTDDGPVSVGMDASFLRNEGGDWACSYGYLVKGSTPDTESLTDGYTYMCIGGGGYEGLSAVLVAKPMVDSFGDEFVGVIFSGSVPPMPEPPAAE